MGSVSLPVLALCALLWADTYAIDDITRQDLRVQLCTRANEPHIIVESRSYERIQERSGKYRYRRAGYEAEAWEAARSEAWWREVKDVRLYVTIKEAGNGPTP